MINISQRFYNALFQRLFEKFDKVSYYSGVIDGELEGVKYKFAISLVIYRDKDGIIEDLIPIWYEFETFVNDEGAKNDFSFEELRKEI